MERGGLPSWFVSTHHSSDGYPNTGQGLGLTTAQVQGEWVDYGKIENGTKSTVVDVEHIASGKLICIDTSKKEIYLHNI